LVLRTVQQLKVGGAGVKKILIFLVFPFISLPLFAGEKLADNLTVMGAEKAGNADGSIPAWTGGITAPPDNYQKGGFRPDPFPGDNPAFFITKDNWQDYKNKLSVGHQAMFQKYADFKLPIYPTRRSASYPQHVYDAIAKNAENAELINNGSGVSGASVAVPFPMPKNGLEAIWNHLLRYRGQAIKRHVEDVAVTSADRMVVTSTAESLLFSDNGPGSSLDPADNILVYLKQELSAPPRLAGSLVLVAETLDKEKSFRRSWLYNPGLRRVSRAPFISYDAVPPSSEGLRTYDQYDMYNGATDRYDWALEGKMELYVPYNVYHFASGKINKSEVFGQHFPRPEYTRYELHRVWKVSATLKKGKNHLYGKRVFYIDEDSWQILVSEEYDGRMDLWRVSEAYAVNFYDVPLIMPAAEINYDLKSGQYLVRQVQTAPADYFASLTADQFTPSTLRREGTR